MGSPIALAALLWIAPVLWVLSCLWLALRARRRCKRWEPSSLVMLALAVVASAAHVVAGSSAIKRLASVEAVECCSCDEAVMIKESE